MTTYATLFYKPTPAVIVNKALISPSSCSVHPKYQGQRKPTSRNPDCTCGLIYHSLAAAR